MARSQMVANAVLIVVVGVVLGITTVSAFAGGSGGDDTPADYQVSRRDVPGLATATMTPRPTRYPTRTPSATASPTVTRPPTRTASPTRPPTRTPSLTATPTPAATRSATPSPSASPTPTATSPATASATATASSTPTASPTAAANPSATETAVPTGAGTATATLTATASPTAVSVGAVARYQLSSLRQLTTNGGRVDWSADGQWIYHDAMGSSGYYDVWQMRPDGSDDSCLTCNQPGLPTKNKGNPAVDPTGRWLVFQAEKQQHAGTSANSQPGMGVWNDLWVMDLQQNQFYQLTNGSAGVVSGSLHPHFSHGGTQLLWSDLQSSSGGEFGDWQLAIATLVTSPTPQLINRVNFNPGPQPTWLEAHGWGPDDSWIYFACDPVAGMSSVNMDICSMSFATPSQVNRLTYTSGINGEDGEWDEHGHLSPDGLVYSYISSTPYGTVSNGGTRNLWLETDLWLMNADGSSPERITYFNEPGHPEYQGGQIVAASDHAWSPDGTQLALDVQIPSTGPNQIWLVTFSVGP